MATSQNEVALQDRERSVVARWQTRLLIAACFSAILILYWPTTAALSELWLDTSKTTYTHGFIVLAIALWLILRDERFERHGPLVFDSRSFAVYVFCSLGWLVAYRA